MLPLTGTITATDVKDANSIKLSTELFAEWNYNLFYPPYVTTSSSYIPVGYNYTSGLSISSSSVVKENFSTKKVSITSTSGDVSFGFGSTTGKAYKIISYMKTNSTSPIIVNTYGTGASENYGGKSEEVSSFGWTRVETLIGSSSTISSFIYNVNITSKDSSVSSYDLYFTDPEAYEITDFDYQNNTLWPTDEAFSNFRPGESYIGTGKTGISFPSGYRQISSLSGYSALQTPISRVFFNPKSIILPPPTTVSRPLGSTDKQNPLLKNGMVTGMSPYKYYVSDLTTKKISAIYEKELDVNKIVLKFNTIITTPTVTVSTLDGSNNEIVVAGLQPDTSGTLILYWNGSTWTSTKSWDSTTMPKMTSSGAISLSTKVKKISVQQTASTFKTEFNNSRFNANTEFSSRMQVIEVSPRLELELSSFVNSVSINKTLDNKSNPVPISSLESNDASIELSGIPLTGTYGSPIPIFSNDSSSVNTPLAKMLRKYVKFSIYHKLEMTSKPGTTKSDSAYIPAGVFYSDTWTQNDVDSVSIQCFDVTRYLQSTPVPDYVGQFLNVEDIISNLLDFAGFTDYDYDSLYTVSHDNNVNMDLAYYFANSKDVTVFEALRKVFGAYQIAAYIDEYGIMKFTSLSSILNNQTTTIDLADSNIESGGYSLTTKAKPGKVSLRYSPPKIAMEKSLQNIATQGEIASPSFYLTTQNEVVWQQQNADSVGFNYLYSDMLTNSNEITLNVGDLLDVFHTFSRDYDGYAIIEDEIVSFRDKQYTISRSDGTLSETVVVKNDIELQSKINQYVKKNMIGLGIKSLTGTASSTGIYYPYDIKVSPTGKIVNVQRGMFGTRVKDHKIITDLASKSIQAKEFNGSSMVTPTSGVVSVVNSSVRTVIENSLGTSPVLIYPTVERDNGYKTYSTTFMIDRAGGDASCGVFFNAPASQTSLLNTYFVGLNWNSLTDRYTVTISYHNGTSISQLYSADATKLCERILNNTAQAFKLDESYIPYSEWMIKYKKITEALFTLKVVRDSDDAGSAGMNLPAKGNIQTGNSGTKIVRVYINNEEVKGWGIVNGSNQILTNAIGIPVSPAVSNSGPTTGTIFGSYVRGSGEIAWLVGKGGVFLREIYATDYALVDPSDLYFHKTQYFLNSIAEGRSVLHNSYMMQTRPAASGIKYYDVQYTTPAATVVDVLPIQYKMLYQPTDKPTDAQYRQTISIYEDNLKYSSPINTGFRGKLMVANNLPIMVFLKKDSDSINTVTANLNLWTRQIVTTSDDMVIEKTVDRANSSETIQIDSEWIQSEDSAYNILNAVEAGLDGFSKDVSLKIFGNPLIQVGDVVNLTYSLNGISNQKYIVHSVSQSFDGGLSTSLVLNKI